MSTSHSISDSTLRSKWKRFVERLVAGNTLDNALRWIDEERRGGHNSGLTVEQERRLAAHIAAARAQGVAVHDDDIQRVARSFLTDRVWLRNRKRQRFVASRAFVWRWKKKYRFSIHRSHPYAKPTIVDPEVDAAFLRDSCRRAHQVHPSLFLNLDETFFKLANTSPTTVSAIGERARVMAGADVRHGFTMVCIVTASGKKLKPVFVKRGTTEVSVRHLNRMFGDRCVWMFAPRGFTKEQTIINIIKNVIFPYTRGQQAVLMMDVYSGHYTPRVLKALQTHNLIPLWVPAGATAQRQPLDVGVMGPLKMIARGIWHRQRRGIAGFGQKTISVMNACPDALSTYHAITPLVIRHSFRKALDIDPWPIVPRHRLLHVIARRRAPSSNFGLVSITYQHCNMTSFRLVRRPILYSHLNAGPPKRPRKAASKRS